jgi:NADH dehydrogenase FAD-containing subunit
MLVPSFSEFRRPSRHHYGARVVTIMVKIAIVGATGPTGIHLVSELRKTVAGVAIARALAGRCNSAPRS